MARPKGIAGALMFTALYVAALGQKNELLGRTMKNNRFMAALLTAATSLAGRFPKGMFNQRAFMKRGARTLGAASSLPAAGYSTCNRKGTKNMNAIPQVSTITPTTPHEDVMRATRLEAANLAESVIDLYEAAFPDDLRLRMALPVAKDVAAGLADEWSRVTAFGIATAAVEDAAVLCETCAPEDAARYWAAADAAEAVMYALGAVVDITAVQSAAESALKNQSMAQQTANDKVAPAMQHMATGGAGKSCCQCDGTGQCGAKRQ